MDRHSHAAGSSTHGDGRQKATPGTTPAATDPGVFMPAVARRDPTGILHASHRILVLGRTGSGKTTLARELAAFLGIPHVELDSLYFGPQFTTVPLDVLRERTRAAISGNEWVADGNKKAVRDLVWPRADTVVWLDYPLVVSLWRLGGRAVRRSSAIQAESAQGSGDEQLFRQYLSAARGVLTALKSHRGQRRTYPKQFAAKENQHLAVVRLRTPRATSRWLARVRTV